VLHHWPEPGVDCHAAASRRWWQAYTAPELRIVITHDRIEAFEYSRRGRLAGPVQCLQHTVHSMDDYSDPHAESPPAHLWETLRQVLTTYAGQRWHVVVVLSNRYVRWLALPWQDQIRSQADQQAYFTHGLQLAFGPEAQPWQLRSQCPGYGKPYLINAMAEECVTQLHRVFDAAKLPIGQLLPAWQLSANQSLAWMRKEGLEAAGWVVCRESTNLTLACLQHGAWQHIRTLPVDHTPDLDWRHTLQQVLLREQALHPERAQLPIYLAQTAVAGLRLEDFSPFKVIVLPTTEPVGQPKWSLA
jgi:hypothetical protein